MKKFMFSALLTVGMLCAANAQDKIAFGVRAGVNVNTLSYSGDPESEMDLKSRAGFHVGAVMDWNFAGSFYLQPGVYFTTRGAKYEQTYADEGDSYSYSEKYNMSYLQIPVLASYRLTVSQSVKIDINAGPYAAFGLGGKLKITDDDYSEKFDIFGKSTDEETRGDFKRFDAGLRFGVGASIRKFYVGVAYDLGLTNLARTGDDAQWGKDTKFRNGSFLVSVGYNF